MPPLLRHWLSFVPVAVMAALVGPDVFFYEGHFNAGLSNLFLMVSLPALLVAPLLAILASALTVAFEPAARLPSAWTLALPPIAVSCRPAA